MQWQQKLFWFSKDISGKHGGCAIFSDCTCKCQHCSGCDPRSCRRHDYPQKIRLSLIPRVWPAWIRFISTCSKAARALRYISGNAITAAAITQPFQVCTILISKLSRRKLPKGLFRLKISSRKKSSHCRRKYQRKSKDPIQYCSGSRLQLHDLSGAKYSQEKKRSLWLPDLFLRKSTEDS